MLKSYMKKLMTGLSAALLISSTAYADSPGCSGKMWNPLYDLDFTLMGGIKVAGMTFVANPKIGEPPAHRPKPLCACGERGMDSGVGAGLTYWLPAYINDISKTAGCLQFLGGINVLPGFASLSGTDMYAHHASAKEYVSSRQVHWAYADLISMAGKSLFEKCGASVGSMEVSYMTEVDFMFQNDVYAAMLSPQAALCAAVPLLCNTASGIESMANTLGEWLDSSISAWNGPRLPLSGSVVGKSSAQTTNMEITIKYLARSAMLGTTMDTMSEAAICKPQLSLLYHPLQNRFQGTFPVKFSTRFNQHEALWGLFIKDNGSKSPMISLTDEAASLTGANSTIEVGSNYSPPAGPPAPGQIQSTAPTAAQKTLAQDLLAKLPRPAYYPTKESGYMQVWEARQCCLVVVSVQTIVDMLVTGFADMGSAEVKQMIELYNTASTVYQIIQDPIGAALGFVGGQIMEGVTSVTGSAMEGLKASMGALTK